MKFLTRYSLHEEKRHDTLAVFAQMSAEEEQALMGDDMRLIGRWHGLAGGWGVSIIEASSAEALATYSLHWNRFMDLEVTPVIDDEAAKQIGTNMVAQA